MFKLISFLVLTMILLPFSAYCETLKAGYFQHVPHHFQTEDKKLRGATFTYFDLVAKKMGYDVQWVGPLPISRLLLMMKQGNLDVYPHSLREDSWSDFLLYPEQSFHYAQAILALRRDTPIKKISSVEDIKNYNINFINDIPASNFIKQNAQALHIELMAHTKTIWQQMLRKVVLRRIDAAHDLNAFTLPYIAHQIGLKDDIKILELPEPPVPVIVAFSKNTKNGRKLLEEYNKVQAEMKFGHTDYLKLIQKEFEYLDKSRGL